MNHLKEYPRVSVIVPTLNAPKATKKCLQSLIEQTYPKDKYEIIVVDNGSNKETIEVIKSYNVQFFQQTILKSPYPSRNLGIRHATGEVIALIDANCVPTRSWLEEGIKSLVSQGADLLGGNVIFTFSPQKTGAEIYDSLNNVQMEENIKERKVAKTANLFFYRYVFEKIGLFPEDLRSGGDVIWTGKAVNADYKLSYSESAAIYKSARKLKPLLQKQIRVGKGQPYIWRQDGESYAKIFTVILTTYCKSLLFLAPNIFKLKNKVQRKKLSLSLGKFMKVFFAGWVCVLATNTGRLIRLGQMIFRPTPTLSKATEVKQR